MDAEEAALRCCCGSPNCAFLAHSGKLLERVERDVDQAARMGQVRRFLCERCAVPPFALVHAASMPPCR